MDKLCLFKDNSYEEKKEIYEKRKVTEITDDESIH